MNYGWPTISGESDTSSTYTGAGLWPLFVALGLALPEVGVVLGLRPVSVVDLMLFVGPVTRVLTGQAYISRHSPVAKCRDSHLSGLGLR